jgi:peptidyl-prolyl cis-trans isomerase SurA
MIKRSLLIEAMLKQEVNDKAVVTLAEARSYYEKNPKAFEHGETFTLQTISIIPPDNASASVVADARKKAEAFWRKRRQPRITSSLGCWRRRSRKTTFAWIWATGRW